MTRGAKQLAEWIRAEGGLRAASRRLGLPHATVGRYVKGERIPDEERGALLESIAGIPRGAWVLFAPTAPTAPTTPRATSSTSAPTTRATSSASAPTHAAAGPAFALAVPPSAPKEPPTLAELQNRLRQIPGELAALRRTVDDGAQATTTAETLRRLLTDEAKALAGAIASSGLATNEEIEQIRALLLGVVQGCDGCRKRLVGAMRELER